MHQNNALYKSRWLLLLSGILLVPFLPFLLTTSGTVLGDSGADASACFSVMEFVGRCFRGGSLPLWNPYVMFGHPSLAGYEGAIFYFLTPVFALFPAPLAFNLTLFLSLLISGLCFYGYLRTLGLREAAALCGALSWCFSSVFVCRLYAGHYSVFLTLSLIPTLFFFWEKWRTSLNPQWLPCVSLAYAALVFAGVRGFGTRALVSLQNRLPSIHKNSHGLWNVYSAGRWYQCDTTHSSIGLCWGIFPTESGLRILRVVFIPALANAHPLVPQFLWRV
jgi:hypothetical protein